MEYKYFKLSEFDSPDMEGSGENMDQEFVQMLDRAREIAGIPFKVNSGFRTREHNSYLLANGYKASPRSSHMLGLAADLSCTNPKNRFIMLQALQAVGFNRIGIASTFIHVDTDPSKPQDRIWVY